MTKKKNNGLFVVFRTGSWKKNWKEACWYVIKTLFQLKRLFESLRSKVAFGPWSLFHILFDLFGLPCFQETFRNSQPLRKASVMGRAWLVYFLQYCRTVTKSHKPEFGKVPCTVFPGKASWKEDDKLWNIYTPSSQPYISTLIETWPCQALGWKRILRAKIPVPGWKKCLTTVVLSLLPKNTCRRINRIQINEINKWTNETVSR